MGNDRELYHDIVADLSIDCISYERGRDLPVRNCYHFSTDGKAVDMMFLDEEDFRAGMNRIYILAKNYRIVILAFVLMDTHVHFLLWGEYDECNRFVHEYVRRTSMSISLKYGQRNKLRAVPIGHQVVDTDFYLKIAICYIVKNPPVGGLNSIHCDYPWSSGPLYFRNENLWTSPKWSDPAFRISLEASAREYFRLFHTREMPDGMPQMIDGIVFPGEYVPYRLVERIFKTHKSYNYFLSITKEQDVDSKGGAISNLSIPLQEMAQNKADECERLFGVRTVRTLNTFQRLKLAKALRVKYNSSPKQIARLCGLIYSEVKDKI
ncbi:MAG: hypothetical protein MJY56_06785 [Bacteroidales bacterium]|nr:hypothetical protein [Bacteroidales bacterium]